MLSVLVVEDDLLISHVLCTILAQLGILNVAEARSGEAALDRLRESRFDLVISDWNMKPMTGLDLLRAVRADAGLSETPFMMITAEPTPERVLMRKKAGMDRHIAKPFERRALLAEIARVTRPGPPGRGPQEAPPPEPVCEGAVSDGAALASLEREFGREGVVGFATLFEAQLAGELAALAAAPGNRDLLAEVAHKLVSSASMMGLVELSALKRANPQGRGGGRPSGPRRATAPRGRASRRRAARALSGPGARAPHRGGLTALASANTGAGPARAAGRDRPTPQRLASLWPRTKAFRTSARATCSAMQR